MRADKIANSQQLLMADNDQIATKASLNGGLDAEKQLIIAEYSHCLTNSKLASISQIKI